MVFSSHCLEHLCDTTAALSSWWGLVKPGGFLILYLPDSRYAEFIRGIGLNRCCPSLVFIDAEHTYEACKKDIETWWPLLREGGIIAGHDYDPAGTYWPGVYKAVNEIFPSKFYEAMFVWSVQK